MDGSSSAIAQYDSQETQPSEFPLKGPNTQSTRVRLVPNTDMWYVSFTFKMPDPKAHCIFI